MTAREVGRIGLRKLLQRIGIVAESMTPLATDPVEVTQLLDARWYDERLRALADELGRDPDSVRAEAAGYLREMAASLDERAVQAWRGFSRWLMRAYDVLVDEDQITQLRKLDRKATLAFAFSHRSYLDGMLLPEAILANRLSPALTFGGANLNFFPMGAWAKRTGAIFIRRQTKDIPVYRFVLRAYAAQLVQNHVNLTWSIEGGRTRTGKLRPPVFGILRYITDAVDEIDGPEVYLVPTSIVYDQLHEVEAMTTEAYGAVKRPEDLRFLVRLARQQGERLGRAYLDFGEPLPLRKRLQEMRADKSGTGSEIERIALDVEHRINRATPVTPTAVVSLASELCRDYQHIDPVVELVPVRPVVHYMMGGVHTDINGATTLPGLYAAGETACVSINGANRLGSNSLPELLVFGARAGRAAADYAARHQKSDRGPSSAVRAQARTEALRLERELSRHGQGGERIADIRADMQATLESAAGIYRDGPTLTKAVEEIRVLQERFATAGIDDHSRTFNTELTALLELSGMLDVALAIVESGLRREESRGAHQRTDFPNRDDEHFLAHTLVHRESDGTLRVGYLPVTITRWPPGERVYGR